MDTRMRFRRIVTPAQAILPILLALPAHSQPVIQSNTRLVQINVLAQDSKGQAIADLAQQDFALEVSGKRRPIQLFAVERNAAPENAAGRSTELPFANRAAPGDPNLVIVLLDEYNTSSMDVAHARKQLIDVFSRLAPRSRVAFYLLTHELKILLDFTTDREALTARLAAHQPELGFTTSGPDLGMDSDSVPEAIAGAIAQAESMVRSARSAHRAEVTLDALNLISAHVTGIRGRKTLVWLTAGVPVLIGHEAASFRSSPSAQYDLSAEVLRTARALERADITVDVVDLRGLRPDDQGSRGDFRSQMPIGRAGASPFDVDSNSEGMVSLVKETGGELFRNSNDIGHAVERAIADSQVSYALGFYASEDELNGAYRPIRVQTSRRGVRLRYRSGFFATPDPTPQARLRERLAALLGVPVALSDISLRLDLQHQPDGKYKLTVHAGPEGLALREENGVWTADFEWLAVGGRNGFYPDESRRLHVALKPDAFRDVMEHGLTLSQTLALRDEDTEIGVALRDVNTGIAGTLRLYRKAPAAHATARQ